MKAKILITAIALVMILAIAEIALRTFDFWGIDYLYDKQLTVRSTIQVDGQVVLPAGALIGKRYTATIRDDYTRLVPASQPSECQIIFIGDSFTFGLFVEDDETFANLIAQELEDIEFLNAGLSAYNGTQVRQSMERFPNADGFVWLLLSNDAEPSIGSGGNPQRPDKLYIKEYYDYWQFRKEKPRERPPSDYRKLISTIQAIAERGTLFFSYNLTPDINAMLSEYTIIAVDQDPNQFRVAYTDRHPNEAGHQDLANRMIPYIQSYVTEVC